MLLFYLLCLNAIQIASMKYVIICLYISIKFFFVTDFFAKGENFMIKNCAIAETPASANGPQDATDVHYNHSSKPNANKILAFYMLKDNFKLPKLNFIGIDSKNYTLKDFRNNLIILYFWATWCTECHAEISSLKTLLDKLSYDDIDDIKLVAISQDFKDMQQVHKFWHQHQLDERALFFDSYKQLMPHLKVKSLPSTFLINKQGAIIAHIERPLDWSDPQILQELLEIKNAATD